MNWRAVVPILSFVVAGLSFVFGSYQYLQARGFEAYARKQLAFVTSTIQDTQLTSSQKKNLMATIFEGLPLAPTKLALIFSGSRASQETGTLPAGCENQGQWQVCQALRDEIRACDLDGTEACTSHDANLRAYNTLCSTCR